MSRAVRERWKKGGYENEIRITVRCTNNPNHAKVLRFNGNKFSLEQVAAMAAVFDGTSEAFILKPNANSPIGRCAVCGEPLTSTPPEQVHAERSQQIDQPAGNSH